MLLERTLICACFRYFHEKKVSQKNKKKICDKDPSNQHSLKGTRSSDMLHCAHLLIQRQIIYDCVRPCPSVWRSADRLCERAPSKTNTGHSHGPLFRWPPSTFLQTPSGAPACVENCDCTPPGRESRLWRTCHVTLQKTENTRAHPVPVRDIRKL